VSLLAARDLLLFRAGWKKYEYITLLLLDPEMYPCTFIPELFWSKDTLLDSLSNKLLRHFMYSSSVRWNRCIHSNSGQTHIRTVA
jgi:hypothetical protein